MAELVVQDSISVETDHGRCWVELCIGSITALKVKDRVDTLVVSAFPGDYSPTPRSVIGALQRDLGISVKSLARDKEEDLRKLFSCWWSKPLKAHLPYGRLLCFEGSYRKNLAPPSTVGEVFRSLVSLTKNKDMTAILPLLAAGDQGYDDKMMLGLIVDAAINWMQAGLPLKVLKIVIFSTNPQRPNASVLRVIEGFGKLKTRWFVKWEEKKQDTDVVYDIYLSYSPQDKSVVERISGILMKKNQPLRIFDKHQEVDPNSSWQEGIHEIMMTCSRVIALLTPNYICQDACIEQFNIAMCCSRKKNILVPFYMQEVEQMPTYIGLIQYMDCRSMDIHAITSACDMVSLCPTSSLVKEKRIASSSSLHEVYDVFISYSHKDSEIAKEIVKLLRRKMKQWNVFFDQKDLRVGSTWQLKLYTSIENTQFVLVLLSENYMESKVCQEEYNLAKSLHDDVLYTTELFEIKLSSVQQWPVWCTPANYFDLSQGEDVSELIERVITEIKDKMEGVHRQPSPSPRLIKDTTKRWREAIALQNFPLCPQSELFTSTLFKSIEYISKEKYDVILSYHLEDKELADILVHNLITLITDVKISIPVDNKTLRLHEIDQGTLIVPLLSSNYVSSSELMEEFHTALCRHRFAEDIVLFPITVRELPNDPAYPQLVFSFFSLLDDVWRSSDSSCDPIDKCFSTAASVICNILVREPKVCTSFRTLFSMRELEHCTDQISRHSVVPLPITFYSKEINNDIWCLDECGNVKSSIVTSESEDEAINSSSTNTDEKNTDTNNSEEEGIKNVAFEDGNERTLDEKTRVESESEDIERTESLNKVKGDYRSEHVIAEERGENEVIKNDSPMIIIPPQTDNEEHIELYTSTTKSRSVFCCCI